MLRCLRSGHSHEDLDQVFGDLSKFISRKGRNAVHPGDFVQIVEQWLVDVKRPFETKRYSILFDSCHDWFLALRFNSFRTVTLFFMCVSSLWLFLKGCIVEGS